VTSRKNGSIVSHGWTLPPSCARAQRHLLTFVAGSDGCPVPSPWSSLSLSCSGGGVASGTFVQSPVGVVHSVLLFEVDLPQLLSVRAALGGRRRRDAICRRSRAVASLFAPILGACSVEVDSLALPWGPGVWWSAWERLGSTSEMLASPPGSRIAKKSRPPNPHKLRLPVPRLLFSSSAQPLL
jgi:hypothetical protein